jgi:probable addiction module antidote protein
MPYDSARFLDSDEAIAAYLTDALEEGDPAAIRHALGVVARARGMTQIARDVGMTREGLYKALGDQGNPAFDTVARVLRALGLRLRVQPQPRARQLTASRSRQTAASRASRRRLHADRDVV